MRQSLYQRKWHVCSRSMSVRGRRGVSAQCLRVLKQHGWRKVETQDFASHEGGVWLHDGENVFIVSVLWCFYVANGSLWDARFCVSTWLVAHFGCAVCLWSWWGKCVYCQCVMMFYVADGSLWDARFCVSTLGWKRGCGVEGMMLWRRMLSLSCPYDVSHGRLVIRS